MCHWYDAVVEFGNHYSDQIDLFVIDMNAVISFQCTFLLYVILQIIETNMISMAKSGFDLMVSFCKIGSMQSQLVLISCFRNSY